VRSEGNSIISWDFSSRKDASFNELHSQIEPTTSNDKAKPNSFLNIYKNSKQSHSTSALASVTSKQLTISSVKNKAQQSPTEILSTPATSNTTEKKSHLFDFYSYYNGKYQENERKKSGRSVSINNTSPILLQLKEHARRRDSGNQLNSRNGYYITEHTQFNMKKFASSL